MGTMVNALLIAIFYMSIYTHCRLAFTLEHFVCFFFDKLQPMCIFSCSSYFCLFQLKQRGKKAFFYRFIVWPFSMLVVHSQCIKTTKNIFLQLIPSLCLSALARCFLLLFSKNCSITMHLDVRRDSVFFIFILFLKK